MGGQYLELIQVATQLFEESIKKKIVLQIEDNLYSWSYKVSLHLKSSPILSTNL